VPWAQDPGLSNLHPPEELRALLKDTGFEELTWIDETAPALRWYQMRLAATPGGFRPLGPHLVFGDDAGEMLSNQVRNLEEGRISIVQAAFERP
jgi:hypothetical protein